MQNLKLKNYLNNKRNQNPKISHGTNFDFCILHFEFRMTEE